ncbi:MAG: Ig-like domain-containing protein [Lachnospiraceae bacterium]|nr:Ig-like domain-containing protein [Lachnospiraceae bacterium]
MQQTRCINCMKEISSDARYCQHCGYDQQTEQPSNCLRPGTLLCDRYQVGRVIGRGGFGITYVGFDLTLEVKVAIKEYYPSGVATRNNSWSNHVVWESQEQVWDSAQEQDWGSARVQRAEAGRTSETDRNSEQSNFGRSNSEQSSSERSNSDQDISERSTSGQSNSEKRQNSTNHFASSWNRSQDSFSEKGKGTDSGRQTGMEHVLREARRTAKLSGVSSVVRVTDAFCENDTAYIVMDFIDGITLKDYLANHGPMTLEECKQLLFPVMEGLAEAHDLGIIHRDISPDNIMIGPDGTAKLLDLGAAVDVNLNNGRASTLVVKNHFSAWEQYHEDGKIGSCTDVYAFAAMLYYCLTGTFVPPVMDRIISQGELTFPEQPQIPEYVKETLKKALAIRQEDRIQDMREFERELAQGDGGSAAAARGAMAPAGTTDVKVAAWGTAELKAEARETMGAKAASATGNGEAEIDDDKTQPWSPANAVEAMDDDKTEPWMPEDAEIASGAQAATDGRTQANGQPTVEQAAEGEKIAENAGAENAGNLSTSSGDGGSEQKLSARKRKRIAGIAAAACLVLLVAGIAIFTYLNHTPSKITVAALPDKVEYCVGESFDEQGMELTVTYLSGRTETVSVDSDSSITIESGTFTTAGTDVITITYGGKSTTLAVTVTEDGSGDGTEMVGLTDDEEDTDSNSGTSGEEETGESTVDASEAEETTADSEDNSEMEEPTADPEENEDTEPDTTTEDSEENTTTKKTEVTTTAQPTTTQVSVSISLNKSSVSAYIGDTTQLKATVSPSGASVTWTSSDSSVVTVDSNGNLKALKKGTATVQASITYSGSTKKASCEVTVKSPSVSLDKSSVSVYVGDTAQLTATVSPSDVSVSYTTSDSSVVTVNSSGKITGISSGTATVKATITYQGTQYQVSCSVTVMVSLTSTQILARAAAEEGFAAEDAAEAAEKKAWEAYDKAMEGMDEGYVGFWISDGSEYGGQVTTDDEEFNGYGVYIYSDGGTYAGEWVDGKRVGYGVYHCENSSGEVFHYAGEWADDTVNGYGVYYFPSGNYYSGEWVNLDRNGYGVWYSSSGTIKAEGLWVNDKLQE